MEIFDPLSRKGTKQKGNFSLPNFEKYDSELRIDPELEHRLTLKEDSQLPFNKSLISEELISSEKVLIEALKKVTTSGVLRTSMHPEDDTAAKIISLFSLERAAKKSEPKSVTDANEMYRRLNLFFLSKRKKIVRKIWWKKMAIRALLVSPLLVVAFHTQLREELLRFLPEGSRGTLAMNLVFISLTAISSGPLYAMIGIVTNPSLVNYTIQVVSGTVLPHFVVSVGVHTGFSLFGVVARAGVGRYLEFAQTQEELDYSLMVEALTTEEKREEEIAKIRKYLKAGLSMEEVIFKLDSESWKEKVVSSFKKGLIQIGKTLYSYRTLVLCTAFLTVFVLYLVAKFDLWESIDEFVNVEDWFESSPVKDLLSLAEKAFDSAIKVYIVPFLLRLFFEKIKLTERLNSLFSRCPALIEGKPRDLLLIKKLRSAVSKVIGREIQWDLSYSSMFAYVISLYATNLTAHFSPHSLKDLESLFVDSAFTVECFVNVTITEIPKLFVGEIPDLSSFFPNYLQKMDYMRIGAEIFVGDDTSYSTVVGYKGTVVTLRKDGVDLPLDLVAKAPTFSSLVDGEIKVVNDNSIFQTAAINTLTEENLKLAKRGYLDKKTLDLINSTLSKDREAFALLEKVEKNVENAELMLKIAKEKSSYQTFGERLNIFFGTKVVEATDHREEEIRLEALIKERDSFREYVDSVIKKRPVEIANIVNLSVEAYYRGEPFLPEQHLGKLVHEESMLSSEPTFLSYGKEEKASVSTDVLQTPSIQTAFKPVNEIVQSVVQQIATKDLSLLKSFALNNGHVQALSLLNRFATEIDATKFMLSLPPTELNSLTDLLSEANKRDKFIDSLTEGIRGKNKNCIFGNYRYSISQRGVININTGLLDKGLDSCYTSSFSSRLESFITTIVSVTGSTFLLPSGVLGGVLTLFSRSMVNFMVGYMKLSFDRLFYDPEDSRSLFLQMFVDASCSSGGLDPTCLSYLALRQDNLPVSKFSYYRMLKTLPITAVNEGLLKDLISVEDSEDIAFELVQKLVTNLGKETSNNILTSVLLGDEESSTTREIFNNWAKKRAEETGTKLPGFIGVLDIPSVAAGTQGEEGSLLDSIGNLSSFLLYLSSVSEFIVEKTAGM